MGAARLPFLFTRRPLLLGQMGKYFSVSELTKSATADRLKIDNTPTPAVEMNIKYLIEAVLDPLREAYGRPIFVSSGYRCEALNKAVGGAKNSQHKTGLAADIYVNGETNAVLYNLLKRCGIPFDQLILEKGTIRNPQWVHVSINRLHNRREILYYNGKAYTRIN